MKFNGTQGKWSVISPENQSVICEYSFEVWSFCKRIAVLKFTHSDNNKASSIKERSIAEADAKLISYAPEMLEYLKHISNRLSLDDLIKYDELTKDINLLIKKATE